MTNIASGRPAWQTDDLADEWIDEEEEVEPPVQGSTSGTQGQGTVNFRSSIAGTANLRGSIIDKAEILDNANANEDTRAGGTFVIREELPAACLPQNSGGKKGMKGIFTPLQLEVMFEPPSPPKSSTPPILHSPPKAPLHRANIPAPPTTPFLRNASRPFNPSKLSQVIGPNFTEDEDEDTGKGKRGVKNPARGATEQRPDEIVETDMPNMGAFGNYKPSPDCRFTFSVPRPALRSLPPLVIGATETPAPNFFNHGPQDQLNASDPRLRLFQFRYDTYTHDHLSAIVDSFGLSPPSHNGSTSRSIGTVVVTSPVPCNSKHDEGIESFSRMRAAKRLKLTPPSELESEKSVQFQSNEGSLARRRDYVGESKAFMQQIRNARDFSMVSFSSPADPEPEGSSRILEGSQTGSNPISSIPSSSTAASLSSTAHSDDAAGSKYLSLAYRKQAADLMAKIKSDKRVFSKASSKGDNSVSSQKSEEGTADKLERSSAPSPEARPQSPLKRRLVTRGENGPDTDPDPDPPSYAASVARSNVLSKRNEAQNGAQNIFAPQRNGVVVMPLAIPDNAISPMADRVRSPNPAFFAPPSAIGANNRFVQVRSESTNEDLNRLVSLGSTVTTTTTLTVGSTGSNVKHAGPAQMVRIAPTDLPTLPERVGGMVFDHTNGRWIKERGFSVARSTSRRPSNMTTAITEGSNESEDPFRDIESLRDEESGRSMRAQGVTTNPSPLVNVQEETNPNQSLGSEDMNIVDSDSEIDFGILEEPNLASFSFDNPIDGIVEVMTGEPGDLSDSDVDETSDSDDDANLVNGNAGFEETEDDFSANFASMSIRDEPQNIDELLAVTDARQDAQGQNNMLNAEMSIYDFNGSPAAETTPCPPGKRRPIIPPRSALKSNSVTPISRVGRSVSFSDGRKDGKIIGLVPEIRPEVLRSVSVVVPSNSQISAQSLRTKRISDLLGDLEESLLEEDDDAEIPSREPGPLAPEQGHPNDPNDYLEYPGEVGDNGVVSRRTFVRTQTVRPTTSSPKRGDTSSHANATFLTECSFGVAHDRLVEVITDVQPFEPYWESLSSIDLSGRKLDSVARLKEFLPRLDSLNLNNNILSWLSGVPGSVRTLSVSSNVLTSLTSFGHLLNLENLDISYNDIDSLQQLTCLRHLRELRADGNKISQLDGLMKFDGLLKLSLQGNELREIDFSVLKWSRLELLSLSNNRLESVRGLSSLPALVSINLDNNYLQSLDQPTDASDERAGQSSTTVLQKLRILRLSGNRLKHLDVSRFPNLRTLYVDNNCLVDGKATQKNQSHKKIKQKLVGLNRLGKLENLSARNQVGTGSRDVGLQLECDDIRDIKRIYLSGNPFPLPLGPTTQACYNLVYLELAACRLTNLPANFSSLIPNVRALNLNYNFLETEEVAQGLVGLSRLRKLTLVGNRMSGTKALVKMLSSMGKNIEMIDFRMNPCTLGWYLPLLVQEKDDNALLQPSEPVKGKSVSPFSLPSSSTSDSQKRRIDAAPTVVGSDGTLNGSTSSTASASPKKEKQTPSHWETLDSQFRRGLPDKAYAGRLAYRGLVMRACPQIKILDGVRTLEKEKRKAEALLRRVLKEAEAENATIRPVEQR